MEKLNVEDLRPDNGKNNHCISLSKLLGKQVKDVHGFITKEFDDPVFEICWIVLDDDTEVGCEGEHDLPYIIPIRDTNPRLSDDDLLNDLYKQENGDDEDE